jgi:hypothetical protein
MTMRPRAKKFFQAIDWLLWKSKLGKIRRHLEVIMNVPPEEFPPWICDSMKRDERTTRRRRKMTKAKFTKRVVGLSREERRAKLIEGEDNLRESHSRLAATLSSKVTSMSDLHRHHSSFQKAMAQVAMLNGHCKDFPSANRFIGAGKAGKGSTARDGLEEIDLHPLKTSKEDSIEFENRGIDVLLTGRDEQATRRRRKR